MLLRFIVLAVYIGAFFVLRSYIRDHPPRFKGEFVYPSGRLMWALLWMGGPLLWFLPGFMWIGMLSIPAWMVVSFSLFIPLSIFLSSLMATGAFPKTTKESSEASLLWLMVGAPILLTLLTFLALPAFPSLQAIVQFALFLVFVSLAPILAVFITRFGVIEIIPVAPDESQRTRKILQLFTGFFTTFPKPTWIVENGVVKTQVKGNQFFGAGPGWIMTEPENIVVLKGGSDIKRIVGPGIILTEPTESPHQVIDLRNQIRIMRTTAITQDGIEVNLPISSLFRVHSGNKTLDLQSLERQEPWPYRNKRDVFQIAFSEEVDPTGKTPLEAHQARPWDDIPLKVALNQLKQVMPHYSLEKLYNIDADANILTRLVVANKVRETVKKTVVPLGYEIFGGGIGNKVVPVNDEVVKQRVEAWKARWITKVLEWQTSAEVKRLEVFTKVRSKARADVLSNLLTQAVQTLPSVEEDSDSLAYHLLENLIHMARNSQVQRMLPETAILTLVKLSETTKGE